MTVGAGNHEVWHAGNFDPTTSPSVTVSTSAPSGGVNGDIWFQVD